MRTTYASERASERTQTLKLEIPWKILRFQQRDRGGELVINRNKNYATVCTFTLHASRLPCATARFVIKGQGGGGGIRRCGNSSMGSWIIRIILCVIILNRTSVLSVCEVTGVCAYARPVAPPVSRVLQRVHRHDQYQPSSRVW